MNIFEYADVINANLEITYHYNQCGRFSVKFERSETKEKTTSRVLTGEYGNGKSIEEAIEDYINCIKGKYLVFGNEDWRQFKVPDCLIGSK